MPIGPGKYDSVATMARVQAHAQGVLLIVFDGEHGSGFSAQLPKNRSRLIDVLRVLRGVVAQMESDLFNP